MRPHNEFLHTVASQITFVLAEQIVFALAEQIVFALAEQIVFALAKQIVFAGSGIRGSKWEALGLTQKSTYPSIGSSRESSDVRL